MKKKTDIVTIVCAGALPACVALAMVAALVKACIESPGFGAVLVAIFGLLGMFIYGLNRMEP